LPLRQLFSQVVVVFVVCGIIPIDFQSLSTLLVGDCLKERLDCKSNDFSNWLPDTKAINLKVALPNTADPPLLQNFSCCIEKQLKKFFIEKFQLLLFSQVIWYDEKGTLKYYCWALQSF
jgi:hypothetical protein